MDKQKEFEQKFSEKNIEAVTSNLMNFANQLMPQMQGLGEELQKIKRPKSQKDIMLDGKNVAMSLTVDGRVFVQFACQDDAQGFFDAMQLLNTPKKKTFWQKIFNK
jgi:hypothetical protein